MPVLRWGLVGAGHISHDFAAALETLSGDRHKVVAVGASSLEKAEKFAEIYSIAKAYGSYEEVMADANVDIIYIGTVNPTHFELCKLALNHGKHVLVEKPFTLLPRHTEELVKLSATKKKFLQEGIWSRFFPVYKKMRSEIEAGKIGEPRQISIDFGVAVEDLDRMVQRSLGGGSMMNIGVYNLQFVVAVFGAEMPEKVEAVGTLNADGCDVAANVTLRYKDGRVAQLATTLCEDTCREATISGSKGSIKVPKPFWCPTEITINGKTESFPLPGLSQRTFTYDNSEGLAYEAEGARRCIEQGLLSSPYMTHDESKLIATLEAEILRQLGVSYESIYDPIDINMRHFKSVLLKPFIQI